MPERLVLALDGSTSACGVALLHWVEAGRRGEGCGDEGWTVAARSVINDPRGQARILLSQVDELLRETASEPAAVGSIVVGTGPGTFTGVRITVATARALSLALSIPITGVSTLSALAAHAAALATEACLDRLVPVVDARRGQVFFATYRREGFWRRSAPFGVCDRQALGAAVGQPSVVVAEDRGLIGELPAGTLFVAAEVRPEHLVLGQQELEEPGALPAGARLIPWLLEVMGSDSRWSDWWKGRPSSAGQVGMPEAVKPIYVRSPDADIHITKMRDPWTGVADAGAPSEGPRR